MTSTTHTPAKYLHPLTNSAFQASHVIDATHPQLKITIKEILKIHDLLKTWDLDTSNRIWSTIDLGVGIVRNMTIKKSYTRGIVVILKHSSLVVRFIMSMLLSSGCAPSVHYHNILYRYFTSGIDQFMEIPGSCKLIKFFLFIFCITY